MPSEHNKKAYEESALLIAQGELTFVVIAERVGVTRETLWGWRKEPEFQQLVANHVKEITDEIRSFGIGQMHYRVKSLQDRHRRLNQVIEERAKSDQMQNAPGGTTGLLCHDVKSVGAGLAAERIDLYELDAALLAEMRAIEQQAAKELGQWVEKQEQHLTAEVEGSFGLTAEEMAKVDAIADLADSADDSGQNG